MVFLQEEQIIAYSLQTLNRPLQATTPAGELLLKQVENRRHGREVVIVVHVLL
jgi:hypothetical protein